MAAILANVGANNWNTNGAWVGGVQPTAADDVTIPATAAVTIPSGVTGVARSINVQAGGTLAFAATTSQLDLGDAGGGAATFSSTCTVTLTGIGTIRFLHSVASTFYALTTGGKVMPNLVVVVGGVTTRGIQFADAVTSSGTITVTSGHLDTNNQTVVCVQFGGNNSNVRQVTLGSSSITCTSTGTAWNWAGTASLSVTTNTATVTLSGSGGIFSSGGRSWNGLSVVLSGAGTQSFLVTSGVTTVAALTRTGTAVKTDVFSVAGDIAVTGAFTVTANSVVNSVIVQSSAPGTQRIITAGSVVLSNRVDFMDIKFTDFGHAMSTNGTDADAASQGMVSTNTIDLATLAAFTMEVRFSRGRMNTNEVVCAVREYGSGASSADDGISLSFNSVTNLLNGIIAINGATVVQIDSLAQPGVGMHTARFVWDGATVAMYVDGVRQGTAAWATGFAGATPQKVGIGRFSSLNTGDAGSPYPMQGTFDEFRLSNTARSTGASYTVDGDPFTTDANTLVLYHLDRVAGAVSTTDSSGNANTGVLTGAPTSVVSPWGTTVTVAGSGATYIGDSLGNSGITPTPAVTQYGVLAGNWSAVATWALVSGGVSGTGRVPLPQDDVVLDAASAAGSYNMDMPRAGRNLTASAFTRTLAFTSATIWYGSFTLGSGMSAPTNSGALAFAGRGSHTITSAGKSLTTNGITVTAPGGTYTLTDALSLSAPGPLTLVAGTFASANQSMNIASLAATGATTKAYVLGTSALSLALNTSTSLVSFTGVTNLTIDTTWSFTPTSTNSNTRNVSTGGYAIGTLLWTVTPATTASLTLIGGGTLAGLTVANNGTGKTLTFTAGTTTTFVTSPVLTSTAGSPISIVSSAPGTAFTIGRGMTGGAGNVFSFFGDAHTRAGYLALDGTGDWASAPDSSALSITGDLEIIVAAALDDWTPAANSYLLAKASGASGQESYALRVATGGKPILIISTDGSNTYTTFTPSATPVVADGALMWVRVTLDVNDGAGGSVATFYTSTDGVNWTMLGVPQTAAALTIFDGTQPVAVGALSNGTLPMAGKVYRAKVLNGIGGSSVLDADFTATPAYVVTDYLSIQDSKAIGNAVWYAGSHSTNVSGNTNWTFRGVLVTAVGQAAAATVANAVAHYRQVVMGQASAASAATAITRLRRYTLGQPVAASAPGAVTPARVHAVGQTVAASSAGPMTPQRYLAVAMAAVAETAAAVQAARLHPLGQVTEADAAAVIAAARARMLGAAGESDAPGVLTPARYRLLGQAAIATAALAVQAVLNTTFQNVPVGQVTEADATRVVTVLRRVLLGQATDAEVAAVIRAGRAIVVSQAVETDTAGLVQVRPVLRLIAELDTASGITPRRAFAGSNDRRDPSQPAATDRRETVGVVATSRRTTPTETPGNRRNG